MENRDKLLSKVSKLLALAKDKAANENEAATALRQAESMMRKHDIAFAEIEAKTIDQSNMVESETDEKRNSNWVWQLAWSASNLSSTMPWKTFSGIVFYGTKQDCEVAQLYFDYLVAVVERMAKAYQGDQLARDMYGETLRSQRNAFKGGMAGRLYQRTLAIKEEREGEVSRASGTGKDLVVMKQDLIKKEFGLTYSKGRRQSYVSGSSYRDGREAANGVSLNQQVTEGSRLRRLERYFDW